MKSYGVWNDDGCLENGMTKAEAEAAAAEYPEEEHAEVHEECPEHEGHQAASCEVCLDSDAEAD